MKTFNIGELSAQSGVASQAIRFYERENLMPEPARTQSNYRRYPEDAIARLQFIVHAKQWGFSLDEIRNLSRIEAVLSRTLEECSGEGPMKGCPIVEAIVHET